MSEYLGLGCWSYSPGGVRCDEVPGHDGPHKVVVETTWTDEEAWRPDLAAAIQLRAPETLPPGVIVLSNDTSLVDVLETASGTCLNCEHAVHDEECSVMVGGKVPCGCNFHG